MSDTLSRSEASLHPCDFRDPFSETRVHGLDHGLCLGTPANIRLIGCDHQHVPSPRETSATFLSVAEQLKLSQGRRREGLAVAYNLHVQRAVAIEKYSRFQAELAGNNEGARETAPLVAE